MNITSATSTPQVRTLQGAKSQPVEVASQQDLSEIGADQREMGLGKLLNAWIWGTGGGVVGCGAGVAAGIHQYHSVLGAVGGGLGGAVVGAGLGYLIGYMSYNSSGDWI